MGGGGCGGGMASPCRGAPPVIGTPTAIFSLLSPLYLLTEKILSNLL